MKVTSTQAAKMVRDLNEKIEQAKVLDKKSRTFLAVIGEDPDTVRPNYDYIRSSQKIDNLQRRLRRVKHAINVFNTQQKLEGFNITIDEALIMLPQLTSEKKILTEMAERLPKERKSDPWTKNIIDYEYVNYDIELVKKDLETTTKLLSELQTELNKVNTTVEFEIPD